jgi:hypothetical protein
MSNIDLNLLKIASVASIAGIAYYKIPDFEDNLIWYRNFEDSIQLSSEIASYIIDTNHESVEIAIVGGVAATAAMVIADQGVNNVDRVWELVPRVPVQNGVAAPVVTRIAGGVPVPAAPPIRDIRNEAVDEAIRLFKLGFSSEIAVISGVAKIIRSKLIIPLNREIIEIGIKQASILMNLSSEEAVLLANVVSYVTVTYPVPAGANDNIVIAKIATLALDLYRSGLSAASIQESIEVHQNALNFNLNENALTRVIQRFIAVTILSEISNNQNPVPNPRIIIQNVDQRIIKIQSNLGDLTNLFLKNCSQSSEKVRELSDSPNVYSNRLQYTTNRTINWTNPYQTIIYDPQNFKITNMNYLLVILYEIIFKEFITEAAGAPLWDKFQELKDKFKSKNPSINDEIRNSLLLKILHNAIINNFEEILNLALLTASNTLINKKLDEENILNKFENLDNDKILNLLRKKEERKTNNNRVNKEQNFYLDENYKSSEPIDIIQCIKIEIDILKKLKEKMGINIKEYSELFFKLGIKNVLRELNDDTLYKINKLDLIQYIEKNRTKIKDAFKFFEDQLSDEIKQKELEFFIDDTVDVKIKSDNPEFVFDNNNIITLPLSKQEDKLNPPQLRLPPIPANNVWTYTFTFGDIYDDLIDTQEKSNIYLYEKIKTKLEYVFEFIILPEVVEFLQFHAEDNLTDVITYDNLKENIRPLIGDIINYHLKIDPSKAKNETISLDDTLNKFKDLFIDLLQERDKISIPEIYNEKLKNKILEFMTLISKYYLNVYRNYLKYVFNEHKYSLLNEVLP